MESCFAFRVSSSFCAATVRQGSCPDRIYICKGLCQFFGMKMIFALTFLAIVSLSAREKPESFYQAAFIEKHGGQSEVTAGDETRCDIVTETHAIEVDFADKWAESIGQSLNYGFQFDLEPGILLVMEKQEDEKHFIRLASIIKEYDLPIKLVPWRAYETDSVPTR